MVYSLNQFKHKIQFGPYKAIYYVTATNVAFLSRRVTVLEFSYVYFIWPFISIFRKILDVKHMYEDVLLAVFEYL